jgi:hypothetical protein
MKPSKQDIRMGIVEWGCSQSGSAAGGGCWFGRRPVGGGNGGDIQCRHLRSG